MPIEIVELQILRSKLQELAEDGFGDLVKAVIDVDRRIMAVGGQMHADEEAALISFGSAQSNLWGINLYPGLTTEDWIEFDSMINVRPSQGNRSRGVESEELRRSIVAIVGELVK